MLRQGYSATTVDQICASAEVTKGSFFHYFESKEAICLTAMEAWSGAWQRILVEANLDAIADPLERLDRLFETMANTYLYVGPDPGCLVGTVAQESSLANASMKEVCDEHLQVWRRGTARLLADARSAHSPVIDFDPDEVADFMLAIVQGSLLVAKTRPDRAFIAANLRHCKAYVESLFGLRRSEGEENHV